MSLKYEELENRITEQITTSTSNKTLTLEQAVEEGRKHEAVRFGVEKLKDMASETVT